MTGRRNHYSVKSRRRNLRQAVDFDKSYPITQGIGLMAPKTLTLIHPDVVQEHLCADCAKRRK